MSPNTQFGSNLQSRKYRCKYCNDEDTRYNALKNRLMCKSCGSDMRVTTQELDKLRIIQTGKKRPDTSGMSKIEMMLNLVHIQDSHQDDHSVCGIHQSGKFSDIKLTTNPSSATCQKCEWNN